MVYTRISSRTLWRTESDNALGLDGVTDFEEVPCSDCASERASGLDDTLAGSYFESGKTVV
jgi:hypothetical protein